MIKIKFKTKEDAIKGYYELSTKGLVRSLPSGIFEIREDLKIILDHIKVKYEVLDVDNKINEKKAIRNSLAISI